HQPHQEEPCFATRARDVDEHLEKIDFREIPGAIRQWDVHLAALPLPFGDRLFHQRDTDSVPFSNEQRVQPRRGQLLFAAGPLRSLRQQHLESCPDRVPHRPIARFRLPANRDRFGEILADRQSRNAKLFRNRPLRATFHQHLVAKNMGLIHLEHPSQRTPKPSASATAIMPSGGSLSERRVDHFPSGASRWGKIRRSLYGAFIRFAHAARSYLCRSPRRSRDDTKHSSVGDGWIDSRHDGEPNTRARAWAHEPDSARAGGCVAKWVRRSELRRGSTALRRRRAP